jgi:hypothetical protein
MVHTQATQINRHRKMISWDSFFRKITSRPKIKLCSLQFEVLNSLLYLK